MFNQSLSTRIVPELNTPNDFSWAGSPVPMSAPRVTRETVYHFVARKYEHNEAEDWALNFQPIYEKIKAGDPTIGWRHIFDLVEKDKDGIPLLLGWEIRRMSPEEIAKWDGLQ